VLPFFFASSLLATSLTASKLNGGNEVWKSNMRIVMCEFCQLRHVPGTLVKCYSYLLVYVGILSFQSIWKQKSQYLFHKSKLLDPVLRGASTAYNLPL
jgi:hypothetical protein